MPLPFLTIPLLTIIISQVIKLSIDGVKGNLTLRHILNDYSGMPSTHSAFVTSLMTIVALQEGIGSASFAIAFVFGLIIIRDALGFRRHLGTYAERLNRITVDLPPLPVRVGHKPAEVFAGCALGFILSIVLYQLNLQ